MNIDKALKFFESYLEDSVKDNVPDDFSDIGMLKYDIKTHTQMLVTLSKSIRSIEEELSLIKKRLTNE